jgi:MFS family permease
MGWRLLMKKLALWIGRKFYYGWVIVFISALSIFFSSPGQTYSISIFTNVYVTEFGLSRSLLSTMYMVATIMSGLLLIFIGRAVDKYGQKKMMIIIPILLALTTLFSSFVSSIVMIFISYFFLRYFGQGSMTLSPLSLVPQWFEKKRSFALSITSIGNLLATLTVPFFNYWLIGEIGWQSAWRFWSLALVFGFVPLSILFVINRPEDIGLRLDNNKNNDEADIAYALDVLNKTSWTLKEALHTKVFWFIGLMSIIVPMFTTGLTFHFATIMSVIDVPADDAAKIIGLIALPVGLVPLVAKTFIDKTQPKFIFFTTQILFLISMFSLAFLVKDRLTATIFILFYGFAASIQSIALNTLWPTFFGRKYLGAISAGATIFMVIGSALGPLPFGLNYDLTGDFKISLFVMMGMTVVAMMMALMIQQPVKNKDTLNSI